MSGRTIAQRLPTARKAHRCQDCFGIIEPGEVYVRSTVADTGEVWTWVEHEGCHNDAQTMLSRRWFDSDDWPSPFGFVEMQNDLVREGAA